MAWYEEAVFYHIYPLGLAGAPEQNSYEITEHRLRNLWPWVDHLKGIGCNALYIGPLFESASHGYDTTDYYKVDSRLGDNQDLKDFVAYCHERGIRVIFDGVFNHTGRDFFAFRDLREKKQDSSYIEWYCKVNFDENNEYDDGFSYENWGGYNLMARLNQWNPEVVGYICEVIRFWVAEFDVDGIRLDAADVLDPNFMRDLRRLANLIKPDFWLMGEVIHGEYNQWVNDEMLHSVTNYRMHKALYSAHNDHNYFEIAHTQNELLNMCGGDPNRMRLYNFVDNHDVERIFTKLNNKDHFLPVHILLYSLPGIPSIYYGSEFGIDGPKEQFSDASLRPYLNPYELRSEDWRSPLTTIIVKLGWLRQETPELSYGDYRELYLTNRQYAFSRNLDGRAVIVTVNNDDEPAEITVGGASAAEYIGALFGERVSVRDGNLTVSIPPNSGEIWRPVVEEAPDGADEA